MSVKIKDVRDSWTSFEVPGSDINEFFEHLQKNIKNRDKFGKVNIKGKWLNTYEKDNKIYTEDGREVVLNGSNFKD